MPVLELFKAYVTFQEKWWKTGDANIVSDTSGPADEDASGITALIGFQISTWSGGGGWGVIGTGGGSQWWARFTYVSGPYDSLAEAQAALP